MDPIFDGTANAPISCVSEADLTLCDREPIRTPGAIQPHGLLLGLDPEELRITHAGGDVAGLLTAAPQTLLGDSASRLFSPDQMRQLRMLAGGAGPQRAVHAFSMAGHSEANADVIAFRSGAVLVVEIELRR